MNFLEQEIIENTKKERLYIIHSPEFIKTNEAIKLQEFLNIIVSFFNNKSIENNTIIYSWNSIPQLRILNKNYGQIESCPIDYKQAFRSKCMENEAIKLSIKIWYSIKIKWLLWEVFYNYKIVKKIMKYIFNDDLSENINLIDIEKILTNIANS